MLEKVHRIQDAGMEVWGGMIVGFDNDDATIFDAPGRVHPAGPHRRSRCWPPPRDPKDPPVRAAYSPRAALPADHPEFVTNIQPLKMGPEELRDGYLRVLTELSDPENYFERTDALFLRPEFDIGSVKAVPDYRRRHPFCYFSNQSLMLLVAIGLFLRPMNRIESAPLRREYRKRLWGFLNIHRRPGLVLFYLFHLVMHYHVHTMARTMAKGEARLVNTF